IAAPPFFHGFGLLALLGPLALGATAICRRRFDAQRTLADITEHSATVLMGVPVMLRRLLAAPALDRRALRDSSLRVVLTGAAPITPVTVRQVIDVFGPILANGYGSTEAGLVSVATPDDLVEDPALSDGLRSASRCESCVPTTALPPRARSGRSSSAVD
ncbi:AMP-binding protein, partial [Microbacterium aurum]